MEEGKNRALREMAQVMIKAKNVPVNFLSGVFNTAYYTLNKVYLRLGTTMTPYEIWRSKKPNLKYFHGFGSTCFILNDREQRSKFDAKSDEGIFLVYSLNTRAYKVYKKRTNVAIESVNVVVDNQGPKSTPTSLDDSDVEFLILNWHNIKSS